MFLPWHRAYLYFFELALQDRVPEVAIPWWDWTSASAHQEAAMVPAASMSTGTAPGVLTADVSFRPTSPEEGRFTRADLVFSGVDHSETSYEVRVFLNNPTADASTPRTAEHGYAGRFVVFGHGGCFGDEGHCEVPASRGPGPTFALLTR